MFRLFSAIVVMYSNLYWFILLLAILCETAATWYLKVELHHGWIFSIFVGSLGGWVVAIPGYLVGMRDLHNASR